MELPIEVVQTFNEDGSFEAVLDVQPATQEMEVSLNSSALCCELPPPISPSGTEGDFQITFMKPPTAVSTPGPSYCEEGFQGTDEPDGGGSVDNCEFKSTVCKAKRFYLCCQKLRSTNAWLNISADLLESMKSPLNNL